MPERGPQPAPEAEGVLVPVGPLDPSILEYLALVLPESTGMAFRVSERALSADAAYDPVRRQWNAGLILAQLDEQEAWKGARRVLGVADLDLFIPILTFVFGLAHLGSRCALVSLHRLRTEFYGLPPASELLLTRLEKEAVHELGHTWRLTHCDDYSCVMHYSNAVEEVDLKTAEFCPRCRAGAGLP